VSTRLILRQILVTEWHHTRLSR